ncbi:MAG: hypothetical protein ACXAC7_08095 [Candidatus Hodarchaeales archaeon]
MTQILSNCDYEVGFLEKAVCGMDTDGYCIQCKKSICTKHGIATSSGLMCLSCASWIKSISSSDPRSTRIIEYPEQDEAFWDDIS